MAKKITTLYISDTCLRLMVTRGRRINKLADAPLDMSLSDVSAKVREAEIVARIKQLFKTHKVSAKKVIIGLSGLHCLTRPAVLPQLPKAMLDEAMMREAKRVLPVPPEQLYISWQILSTSEGKMQAFMVAIPRQIADTLLRILQQVGVKPYLMDIKPLALVRLVKEPTALIVDIQAREFDIVILADGVPQPIRSVSFPDEKLSLPDKLSLVKDELKRTVQFYNSNNTEKPINSSVTMLVSGELAEEPELCESLATELGYRVLPLSSPLKCPKQLDPSHYLVNVGLALKELRKETSSRLPNVNTLPVSYQPIPFSLGRVVALPGAAVAIGFIVILALNIQGAAASIDSVNEQLDATNFILKQRQTQKKELTDGIAALEKKVADAEAARKVFTAILDSLNNQGDKINGDFQETVKNVVSGLNLRTISHSGQDLNIRGWAPSEVEVLEYAGNLDASGRFSEVTVATITRVDDAGAASAAEGTEGEGIEGEEGADEGMEDEGLADEGLEDEGVAGEGVENNGAGSGVDFTLMLKLKGS